MYTDHEGNPNTVDRPQLWSDFDGTVSKHYPMYVPMNWSKWPLPRIPGYSEFIRGVEDGNVDIAGVISRRPKIRRPMTAASIAQFGLRPYFKGSSLVHAGSEQAKAAHVAKEACKGPTVGMIEDKIFKFGTTLLEVIQANHSEGPVPRVVIGATDTPHQAADLERFGNWAADRPDLTVLEATKSSYMPEANRQFTIYSRETSFSLGVVALDPYSFEAGQDFAQILTTT